MAFPWPTETATREAEIKFSLCLFRLIRHTNCKQIKYLCTDARQKADAHSQHHP